MNADDFRDYMLSFLFLRYLSDNYEQAAKKELRRDYPDPNAIENGGKTPISVWNADNPSDVAAFEKQMRRKVHYVVKPEFLWGNIVHLAKTHNGKLLLNVRHRMVESGGTIGKILGMEKNITTYNFARMNMLLHGWKGKRQNVLTEEHILRIIETYQYRRQHDRYSRRVKMKEIATNDYNLNISRYVSTAKEEAEIDLAATHGELVKIENLIREATTKHNQFLRELGLSPLPSPELNLKKK
jgi:type I restriction-modification system DNA methylase subunit